MISDNRSDVVSRFSNKYRDGQTALCQEIEHNVFGCVYGATSWTTRDEADDIAKRLGLGPKTQLLDVGAGTGWPSIYWAEETGCQAICLDLPLEGLQMLQRRAQRDGVPEKVTAVQGNGVALPFGNNQFDAIFHSDVFC